jgi:hypothetical protein
MLNPDSVARGADGIARLSARRGNMLTLQKCLLTTLLLVSPAAGAQYAVTLHFPDHSIEVCAATDFALNYLMVNVDVVECTPDRIFSGNMGG